MKYPTRTSSKLSHDGDIFGRNFPTLNACYAFRNLISINVTFEKESKLLTFMTYPCRLDKRRGKQKD
jgi:hypothetical protein